MLRDAALGRPRQLLCPNCERLERHGLKPVALPIATMSGVLQSHVTPLGTVSGKEHMHRLEERVANFDEATFSVQPSEIDALYQELMRNDTPVVIAVAPTGAGKSTFLPYRLVCPKGKHHDTFTRGRQIVVTQPRRKAAVSIPRYVAGALHGADFGIGHEIGYRVKGEHACDWRNRLTYVTDGTLINWLVRGELDRISLIIIDEAHERSINIDVILGLLTRALPQFPHLKMLIVSATIDHAHFQRHFERRLPKGLRCGIVVCSGTKPQGLIVHYRNDSLGVLPYMPGSLKEFSRTIPGDLAKAILRLLLAMDGPAELADRKIERGDVLGFLHGKREIQEACESIVQYLAERYPRLAAITDVYPYHAEVDAETARKATEKKPDPSRRRIVIASNAAETSLTIEGLVHVAESGFIKQTRWDPVLEQAPLLPVVHSQAGCRQRWGRAGRVAPGWTWCLYTKSQFAKVFPAVSVPEIQRSCLDGVVLRAKRGGADRIEEQAFPWLDAPAKDEIERTLVRLQRQRLLDQDGDLTEPGVLAAMANEEDALYNRLLADGDRFGFGIDVCTLVPFLEIGLKNLFPDDKTWDDATRRAVREAQKRVRNTCSDDLELCLRIYSEWQNATLPPSAHWVPPRLDRREAEQCDATVLSGELKFARDEETVIRVIRRHIRDTALRQKYGDRALSVFRRAARTTWPQTHGIDVEVLAFVEKRRASLIQEIGAKKKGMEDRSIDFAGLNRLRAIIARAFADQVHVRVKGDSGAAIGVLRYTPLVPVSKETIPVEIAAVSNCATNPPDTFVALGPKESLPAKGERESIRLAPFAVRVEMSTVEAVLKLDDLALAEYLRYALPRPAQGSAEDARLRQHEQLRSQYPVGTIVECRLVRDFQGISDVDVIRVVGWGGGPPLKFGSSETWQELREHEHNKSFDATNWSSSTKDGPRRQSIAEEVFDLISEEIDPIETDARPADHVEVTGLAAKGRLQWFGTTRMTGGQSLRAEVTRHSDITGDPSLILVSPPLRERFIQFAKMTRVGDEIETEVIGPSPRGSFERGLQVRDLNTGLEFVIPTEEVLLRREDSFLTDIEPGSRLRVHIEYLEHRTRVVFATALNALEPDLTDLHASARKEAINGVLRDIEVGDRDVFMIAAVSSRRSVVPAIPVKIVIPRQRFEGPHGFAVPYAPGRKVALNTRADATSDVECRAHLTTTEKAALAQVGIQADGGRLSYRGRLTFEARALALRTAETIDVVSAVRLLFTKSNLLYADLVIPELLGKTVECRVQTLQAFRVEVILAGGIVGLVEPSEASWFARSPRLDQMFTINQVIRAVVLSINEKGQAILSTKRARISQDPWASNGIATLYPVGTTLVCKIASAVSGRAWVEIEPGLQGSSHVKELRALAGGGYIKDATTVATPGRWVTVRVLGYDAGRKQLNIHVLGWAANPPAEVAARTASQTTSATPPPAQISVDWLAGPWPWDAGENAIPKAVVPPKPPALSPSRKRPPLEHRSSPSAWRILL
jgi:HrpA-like RNA helicase/predicted RNA-binding protein with RPS1 domain